MSPLGFIWRFMIYIWLFCYLKPASKADLFWLLDLIQSRPVINIQASMQAQPQFETALRELQIKLANTTNDKKQVESILNYILCYPNLQQAYVHHRARNLGTNDLLEKQRDLEKELNQRKEGHRIQIDTCPCCGLLVNSEELTFKTNLNELNLGVGVFLYFKNYLFHVVVFLLMFAIYSLFALITNIKAFNDYNGSSALCILTLSEGCGLSPLGAGSKVLHQNDTVNKYSQIQSWLGIAFVIVWGLLYVVKTHHQQQFIFQMEEKTISASDFTLMLTHVPRSYLVHSSPSKAPKKHHNSNQFAEIRSAIDTQLSPSELQQRFNKIFVDFDQKINQRPKNQKSLYEVVKVNIAKPLYNKKQEDAAAEEKSNEQRQKLLAVFRTWIEQRQRSSKFKIGADQRNQFYTQYQNFCEQSFQKEEERKVGLAEDNVIFVTMKYSQGMREIAKMYRPASIRNFWNLCNKKQPFPIEGVKVRRAPHPEQIKWQCVGFPLTKKRCQRFAMWMLTILLIGVSLGISIGIAFINKNSVSLGVSIGISIVVTIFNVGIQIVIAQTSFYENQYVSSREQTMTALKIGLGQLVNSIGVPIIVTLISRSGTSMQRKSWLQSGGLVDDIFFIAAINAIVPLVFIFDPWEHFLRIKRWWYSKPNNRLNIYGQAKFNEYFGNYVFDIGYEYAYLIKTAVFTAFFVAMQPIIAIFGAVGLVLYYLVSKRNLYYYFQRPNFHSATINSSVDTMLLLAPVAFGFGCLLVNNFIEDELSRLSNGTLLTNWIIVMIAVGFLFVVPLKIFYCCIARPEPPRYDYQVKRAMLSTDYDILNPQTKGRALAEFKTFLDKLEEQKRMSLSLGQQASQHEIPQGFETLKMTVYNKIMKQNDEAQNQLMKSSRIRSTKIFARKDDQPQFKTDLNEYQRIANSLKPEEQRMSKGGSNNSADHLG